MFMQDFRLRNVNCAVSQTMIAWSLPPVLHDSFEFDMGTMLTRQLTTFDVNMEHMCH